MVIIKKYIIPPRLNEKMKVFGLTVYEAFIFAVVFFIALGIFIKTRNVYIMIIPAVFLVSRVRFINGENICEYGKKVYNYFFKTQSFGINGE